MNRSHSFLRLHPSVAISCLTTSNLLWFMDLMFQVPMQNCSLHHQTLLPSLVIPTTGRFFHFGSVSLFPVELFLHSSPVVYWAPTNLGSSSFSVISFCLFILFMGFSRFHEVHGVSCICWLYICLWRNVYTYLLPILKSGMYVWMCIGIYVAIEMCEFIFQILTPYQHVVCTYFLLFYRLPFHFINCFLYFAAAF